MSDPTAERNAELFALVRRVITLPGAPLLHPNPVRGAGYNTYRHLNGLQQVRIIPPGAEIGDPEWVIDLSDNATGGQLLLEFLGAPWVMAAIVCTLDGRHRVSVGRPDRTGQVVAEYSGDTLAEACARAADELKAWPRGRSPLRERTTLARNRRCTQTFHRRAFDVLEPDPADVEIADIARALSQKNRFNGHTLRPYSVAEHSVRVSRLLQAHGHPIDVQLWGLLHDAAEAYLPDVARPVKRLLGKLFADLEAGVMAAIAEALGLPGEQPSIIRWADNVLLATERDHLLLTPIAEIWEGLPEPLDLKAGDVLGWSPEKARAEFLRHFYRLTHITPTRPLVLAFCGLKGSGKDTAAAFFAEHLRIFGYTFVERMAFAQPFKAAAREWFDWSHAHTDGDQATKEGIDPAWDLSPRRALQYLGTEIGRELHPDVWMRHLQRRLHDTDADAVLVTDCRYQNEAKMLRDEGAVLIRIERPGQTSTDTHASEQEAARLPASVTLLNDGSLDDLRQKVQDLWLLLDSDIGAADSVEGSAA